MQALRPIRYKGFLSVFGSVTEPKMIEKIPVATLVDSFFDIAGLTAKKELSLLELADLVDKLPDSEGKKAFISWINQGVTNIADLRTRTTAYFTGILEQAAETFRARARSFVIILSIGITVLFGTEFHSTRPSLMEKYRVAGYCCCSGGCSRSGRRYDCRFIQAS